MRACQSVNGGDGVYLLATGLGQAEASSLEGKLGLLPGGVTQVLEPSTAYQVC